MKYITLHCFSLLIWFLLLGTLNSCENQVAEIKEVKPVSKEINLTVGKPKIDPIKNKIDEEMYEHIVISDSIYGRTPYYFIDEVDTLYYVTDSTWIVDAGFSKQTSKQFGICNSTYELILPMNFEKILNPNITAEGFIEIKNNGKYGLFNFKDSFLIPCDYDLIFPSLEDNEAIAFGKINTDYFKILANGEKLLTQPIDYKNYINEYKVDSKKSKNNLLHNSYSYYTLNDANDGTGVLFTPSFIDNLKILPEYLESLFTSKDETFGSVYEMELVATKSNNFFTTIINSFIETGIEMRGFQIEKQRITCIDSNQNFVSSKEITKQYFVPFCNEEEISFNFLNDTFIVSKTINETDSYEFYDFMNHYIFYSIDKKGDIDSLESVRIFNYTQHLVIDSSFFYGCFSKKLETYEDGNLVQFNHLSIEDLDVMRNEIFANYGYIFKSKKWKDYFNKKAWYNPNYENVDSLLTKIDKANIQVILKAKERLIDNPNLRKKEKISYGMAG